MITTIYLVRHGQRVRKAGDVPLTILGKKQAEITGKFLLDKNIDLILSSPQKRALQTAEIIQQILKTPPLKVNDILKERFNFGDVKNQTYEEFTEMLRKSSLEREWVLPNGESSIAAGRRMESVMPIVAMGAFRNILIATHGGIICDFLRNVFTIEELNSKKLNFEKMRETAFGNCSITQIVIDGSEIKLISIADSSHLT
jgi:broad specificity phosphatase PhoE